MSAINAVFFDLYETIITEFDPQWQPMPTAAERLGIEPDLFQNAWRSRQHQRMIGLYTNYQSVLQEICAVTETPIDNMLIEQLNAERLADKAIPFAHVTNEIIGALQAIRRLGVKIGLISNCSVEEVAAWGDSVLPALFDDAVFSYQVGYAKPAPEIYDLACRRLGVHSEDALFIGDGGSNELAGAVKAGMRAYQATWFLLKWPAWKTPDQRSTSNNYPVVRAPNDVVALVASGSTSYEFGLSGSV